MRGVPVVFSAIVLSLVTVSTTARHPTSEELQ